MPMYALGMSPEQLSHTLRNLSRVVYVVMAEDRQQGEAWPIAVLSDKQEAIRLSGNAGWWEFRLDALPEPEEEDTDG